MKSLSTLALFLLTLLCCAPPSGSMPTALTPASPPQFPAAVLVPQDGNPLSAPELQVDYEQPVFNATEAARELLVGGGTRYHCVGTTSNISIKPLGAILVRPGGVGTPWVVLLNRTTTSVVMPGGLAANTRYYVYAYDTGAGVLGFQTTVDPPDDALQYRTGPDQRYAFVTTFYTDQTSAIIPYTQAGQEYTYLELTSSATPGDGNFIAKDTAAGFTNHTWGASVPPMASIVKFATLGQIGATSTSLSLTSGALPFIGWGITGASGDWLGTGELAYLGPLQVFAAYVSTADPSTSIRSWVRGFSL